MTVTSHDSPQHPFYNLNTVLLLNYPLTPSQFCRCKAENPSACEVRGRAAPAHAATGTACLKLHYESFADQEISNVLRPVTSPCPRFSANCLLLDSPIPIAHVGRHRLSRSCTRLSHSPRAQPHMRPASPALPYRTRRRSKSNWSSCHLGAASGAGSFSLLGMFRRERT